VQQVVYTCKCCPAFWIKKIFSWHLEAQIGLKLKWDKRQLKKWHFFMLHNFQ